MIVPVRDGARTLTALLDSLEGQTLAHDRFEVIVVDNGSRDRSGEIAAHRGAIVVHEPRPNRAGARNRGMAEARADRFAFTDADCVAARRWLEALLECADSAPLVAGPVEVVTGERPNVVERFESLWRFDQEQWVRQGWAATANLSVAREAAEAIGGFDASFRHIGEDADFCVRAGRAGLALGFCSDARVVHRAEERLAPMLRRAFLHGYSVNQIHHRHGLGYRAWRRPLPALAGDTALTDLGWTRDRLAPPEYRRMRRLARAAYGARIAGSLWAELSGGR